MKILLLSFYFPPDLSAGSFRARALVDGLRRQGGGDLQVDVITSMPNRYATFSSEAHHFEDAGWLKIHRMKVPSHDSGMAKQSRTFAAYARQALARTKGAKWDVVVATSSRLMTAALATEVSRRTGAPLYLDIRDIFTDTMGDMLRSSPARIVLPLLKQVERRAVRYAARVNLVSPGFLPYFNEVDPSKSYRLFTNGIDEEFLETSFEGSGAAAMPTILYAGNIGEGQGLHKIVPKAAKLLEGKAHIQVIGGGGRRSELEQALSSRRSTNVELLDPMSRKQLMQHYRDADILFLHLNNHEAFKKVLPSKVFEYAATGKPILAGLGGYSARFVRENVLGAEVFEPCDAEGMASAFHRLKEQPPSVQRADFCEAYARIRIMDEWAADIVALTKARCS